MNLCFSSLMRLISVKFCLIHYNVISFLWWHWSWRWNPSLCFRGSRFLGWHFHSSVLVLSTRIPINLRIELLEHREINFWSFWVLKIWCCTHIILTLSFLPSRANYCRTLNIPLLSALRSFLLSWGMLEAMSFRSNY